jgi:hypothetical protein
VSSSRLYNEDITQLESELARVLDVAIEGGWEEIARKELDSAKKTSRIS